MPQNNSQKGLHTDVKPHLYGLPLETSDTLRDTGTDNAQAVSGSLNDSTDFAYTIDFVAKRHSVTAGTVRQRWFSWLKQAVPEQFLKTSSRNYSKLAVQLFDEIAKLDERSRRDWRDRKIEQYKNLWDQVKAKITELEVVEPEIIEDEPVDSTSGLVLYKPRVGSNLAVRELPSIQRCDFTALDAEITEVEEYVDTAFDHLLDQAIDKGSQYGKVAGKEARKAFNYEIAMAMKEAVLQQSQSAKSL